MRKPHRLTGTKRSIVPRRMVFFDSEAYTEIEITQSEIERARAGEKVGKPHEPYLVAANFYNRRKDRKPTQSYRTYDNTEEGDFLKRFWTEVDEWAIAGSRTYIFAHNAKYDILVTAAVYWFVEMGYIVTSFSSANPFILVLEREITHNKQGIEYMKMDKNTGKLVPAPRKKTLVVLSSTNFYAQTLASLGKIYGLPKLEFPHGKVVDMADPEDREQALTYVKRDVEILTVAMLSYLEFIEREDLGPFAKTLAGQAFTAFRHRFNHQEIMIHSNPKALEVERRAYAGGRNECFALGEIRGRVSVYDINSMYPYVMKNFLYPTRLVSFWRNASKEKVLEMIQDDYLVVCDARIKTDYPIFHIKKDRLTFPTGDFWTTLTTPELIQAYERGLLVEVKNICLYEAGNIFEPYVKFFYNERLKAKEADDAIHDLLFKLFLNTLYGKFGQKNNHWDKIDDADPYVIDMQHVFNAELGKYEWVKIFGGAMFARNNDPDDQEAFNSFCAVAAHVTGYARMLIWSIIETAGRENVYYTDTDSVFVNDEGAARLEAAGMVDGKRLGALKLEKSGRLWLNGCKDYMGVWGTKKIKRGNTSIPGRKRLRRARRRCGKTWRWGVRKVKIYPKRVRRTKMYYKEIKIKGIPKNAVPLGTDENGLLQFAITQWGGFSDRFKAKDFKQFENKVIVKTLSRDYTKAMVEGTKVTPFVLDHDEEERQAAKEALERAKKETAAAMQDDFVRRTCLIYGYIRAPKKGERHYGEYEGLPKVSKLKYFRKDGVPMDIWAEDNGFTVRDLLDYVRG